MTYNPRTVEFFEKLERAIYLTKGTVPPIYPTPGQYRAYLEKSQPLSSGNHGRPSSIIEQVDDYSHGFTERPTKYQNPLTYRVLTEIGNAIRKAADAQPFPAPAWPLLGAMSTSEINAMAVPVPHTDEHIIIFDEDLVTFAFLVSNAVLQTFPTAEPSPDGRPSFSFDRARTADHIRSNRAQVTSHFSRIIESYISCSTVRGIPGYVLTGAHREAAKILRHSMTYYVMGHEYAHVALGHLGEASYRTRRLAEQEINTLEYSWKCEYEADLLGLRLSLEALNVHRGYAIELCYWGAELFFSALEVLDQAASRKSAHVAGSTERIGTHPPAVERREFLRQALTLILPAEHAEGALAMGDAVTFATEQLWEHVTRL